MKTLSEGHVGFLRTPPSCIQSGVVSWGCRAGGTSMSSAVQSAGQQCRSSCHQVNDFLLLRHTSSVFCRSWLCSRVCFLCWKKPSTAHCSCPNLSSPSALSNRRPWYTCSTARSHALCFQACLVVGGFPGAHLVPNSREVDPSLSEEKTWGFLTSALNLSLLHLRNSCTPFMRFLTQIGYYCGY